MVPMGLVVVASKIRAAIIVVIMIIEVLAVMSMAPGRAVAVAVMSVIMTLMLAMMMTTIIPILAGLGQARCSGTRNQQHQPCNTGHKCFDTHVKSPSVSGCEYQAILMPAYCARLTEWGLNTS